MESKKTENVSLCSELKETFGDRIKQLIGSKSLRAASKEWDLPYANLNNYINRGTEPGINIVRLISERTGARIEWLVTGQGDMFQGQSSLIANSINNKEEGNRTQKDHLSSVWDSIFKALPVADAEALINTIHRKGVYSLLDRTDTTIENDLVEQFNVAVERLAPRNSLARAIKAAMLMGLDGDEEADKEIYEELMASKRAKSPGDKEETLSPVSNEQKKTG